MRLLNTYTLELEERFDNIPPYAILSHTWGEEEVTFQDINDGSGRRKKGWSKIQNCCKIAKRYGYEYAWVDTCCIDKSSSSELTEAINSMFNWYLNSSVCYVFLEDLHDKVISEKDKLRWFSRGWTLQELIAPGKLRFRNSQWEYVGTRRDLSPVINHITGIPTNILEHKGDIIDRLSRKSIAERMSWAAGRITKRSEDRAYSLMGLFSVNMPLLYGEGGANAFFRLQEAIMKKSMDRSILCCLPPASLANARTIGCLAEEIDQFGPMSSLNPGLGNQEIFSLTQKGLEIHLPLLPVNDLSSVSDSPIFYNGTKFSKRPSFSLKLTPGRTIAILGDYPSKHGWHVCLELTEDETSRNGNDMFIRTITPPFIVRFRIKVALKPQKIFISTVPKPSFIREGRVSFTFRAALHPQNNLRGFEENVRDVLKQKNDGRDPRSVCLDFSSPDAEERRITVELHDDSGRYTSSFDLLIRVMSATPGVFILSPSQPSNDARLRNCFFEQNNCWYMLTNELVVHISLKQVNTASRSSNSSSMYEVTMMYDDLIGHARRYHANLCKDYATHKTHHQDCLLHPSLQFDQRLRRINMKNNMVAEDTLWSGVLSYRG